MTTALSVLELGELRDPQASAEMVYYLGAVNLPKDGIPPRRIEMDEATGEVRSFEGDREYINRVWPGLDRETKGLAVRAGLQYASFFREALGDGIQLVVYRARRHGWWIATDQAGGGDEAAFREWVKDAVTAEDASTTEATQLASTILNLEYLAANGYRGLPAGGDLEPVFADRQAYNRWRRVASRLRRLVELVQEQPSREVRQSIQEIVDAVTDPGVSLDDLDQAGRIKPSLPPVTMEMSGRDKLGRHLCEFAATAAQMTLLKSRLKDAVTWLLKGEQYGVAGQVLAEYRTGRGGLWRRVYRDEGWGAFEEVEGIGPGTPEGATLEDPDWELAYQRQWEERERS